MSNLIEITDNAIQKIIEKQEKDGFTNIRLGITGGGCAGFEYVFDSVDDNSTTADDVFIDYGKFGIVIDKISIPYLAGMTLDWQTEGLNEFFKFVNPKEKDSCGCGVSINFDLDAVERDNKITAINIS